LKVSALTMGTMTFGGRGVFRDVGNTGTDEARRQVDLCLEAGVNLIDTADVYSAGRAEEIVGAAVAGRRDDVLLATKVGQPLGEGANDVGLSRHHIVAACEASLQRLGTDHIDLYQVHEWDGITPPEETIEALSALVTSGKVRYIGVSNYTGWQLARVLGTSDRLGLQRFVSHQIYYSLQAREAEYELVPSAIDQGLGILVWSPLAGGLLSGKYRRGRPVPKGPRLPLVYDEDKLYDSVARAREELPEDVLAASFREDVSGTVKDRG
jgi:aryl-alcohol dehydrogenase-like predicted oxidoreductase